MKKLTTQQLNAMFADIASWEISDAEINKATGIWKRAQQQIGIPLPPETRQKISEALKGRRLSAETRAKISASLKAHHQKKKKKKK